MNTNNNYETGFLFNSAVCVDDNDMTQQTSTLPPDAEEISQELDNIWEEILHEVSGTKEITCHSSIPNFGIELSHVTANVTFSD